MTVVLGLEFNFANVIALPLLLGVGVDNGIHIVHRMRSEPPLDGNLSGTSTSRAVLASGLTTIASFGNLAFASHLGMSSMGQVLTIGMIAILAATLILLPALLKTFRAA
jgi:predicted RND superfamily exporter protein